MLHCINCGLNSDIPLAPKLQHYVDLASKLEDSGFQVEDNQYYTVLETLKTARADTIALQRALERITELCFATTKALPVIAKSLAPIRRLPDDVLAQIFGQVAPNIENNWKTHYLWTLSHVSSRWRNIIRSTSRWWSTIAYTCSTSYITNTSRMAMQMMLSGSQPLHVIIQDFRPSPSQHRSLLATFTNYLWLHHFRLASASITTFAESLPLIFSPSQSICTLPRLTRLCLTLHQTESVSNARGLFLTHNEAPALIHVELCSITTGQLSLPWSQLKTLSFARCSLVKVIPILPMLSKDRMENLNLDIMFDHVEDFQSAINFLSFRIPNVLQFPNLHTLKTTFKWPWSPIDAFELQQNLLSRFHLPGLNHWSATQLILNDLRPITSLTSALVPSLCRIDLNGLLFTDETQKKLAITLLLKEFSNAKFLYFGAVSSLSNIIIEVLLENPEFCTQLQQLDLDNTGFQSAFTPKGLTKLLKLRKCCVSWIYMNWDRHVVFSPSFSEAELYSESTRRYKSPYRLLRFENLMSE